MTERHLSDSLRDLYSTLKVYEGAGKTIPVEALPLLLKVALTARFMAEELEDELALATRIIADKRKQVDPDKDKILVLPFRPRVVSSAPDGGDAA